MRTALRGPGTGTHPAFVLGTGVNGLGVVRSLGRHQISVAGVQLGSSSLAGRSRYCRLVKIPSEDPEEVVDALIAAAGPYAQGRPVLFPTTDRSAAIVNEYQEKLRPHFLFAATDRSLFSRLNSKSGIIELTARCGIPSPWAAHFTSPDEVAAAAHTFPYPIIIKPVDTFRRTLPSGAKNEIMGNPQELLGYVERNAAAVQDMVFQKVIESGDGQIVVCTLLVDDAGEVLLSYTGRKLRQYLPDFGVTTFGVSERHSAALALSRDFVTCLGYQGLCTLEFSEGGDGQLYFLEANLRSYYHNQLFTDCGLNFPLAEYWYRTGDPRLSRVRNWRQEDGVHWLDFNRDLGSFWRKRARKELSFGPWARSLLNARSFAAFAVDDPLPAMARGIQFLRQNRDRLPGRGPTE